tara:strand:+ start:2239 stop:2448 length:210 start_codon:yes stop_codon:yes gene_type:complete
MNELENKQSRKVLNRRGFLRRVVASVAMAAGALGLAGSRSSTVAAGGIVIINGWVFTEREVKRLWRLAV